MSDHDRLQDTILVFCPHPSPTGGVSNDVKCMSTRLQENWHVPAPNVLLHRFVDAHVTSNWSPDHGQALWWMIEACTAARSTLEEARGPKVAFMSFTLVASLLLVANIAPSSKARSP